MYVLAAGNRMGHAQPGHGVESDSLQIRQSASRRLQEENSMKHIGRKLAVPAVGLALAGGSFAFLDSNTVAASDAGSGSAAISGYNVSDVHYTYLTDEQGDATDTINSVTFTLDKAATQVSAAVTGGYTFHYNQCDNKANSYTWTCTSNDGPGGGSEANSHDNSAPVSAAKTLTVTAVE
jgi:hypothetical protein